MKLCIKYFGMISEWARVDLEKLDFTGTTVSELKKQLQMRYPQLHEISYEVAVNQKIALDTNILTENDEVAILPPFSGG